MWPAPVSALRDALPASGATTLSSVAGVPLGPQTDPAVVLPVALATLAGCLLGTCSGLVPGLHANNFALLLAGAAPHVPVDPLALGAAMLAAGVVHTFLDIVPSLALGVPDSAMAAAALPGHRLVLRGRGREALRLSALGSGAAVAVATLLALPVTWVMLRLAPVLTAWFPAVAAAVLALLLLTEPSHRARLVGLVSFALATALGAAVLGLSLSGPIAGGVLAPLFGGLFGAPVLLDALDGGGVPAQDDAKLAIPAGSGYLGGCGRPLGRGCRLPAWRLGWRRRHRLASRGPGPKRPPRVRRRHKRREQLYCDIRAVRARRAGGAPIRRARGRRRRRGAAGTPGAPAGSRHRGRGGVRARRPPGRRGVPGRLPT